MRKILFMMLMLFSVNSFAGNPSEDESTDSDIVWEKSQEHRLSLKLSNPLCSQCRIAPLCGGGCSRYILDKKAMGQSSHCVFNDKEAEIDEFIVNHVEKIIRNQRV